MLQEVPNLGIVSFGFFYFQIWWLSLCKYWLLELELLQVILSTVFYYYLFLYLFFIFLFFLTFIIIGRDLAQLCKQEYNKTVCGILWIVCEVAIAATDLAEGISFCCIHSAFPYSSPISSWYGYRSSIISGATFVLWSASHFSRYSLIFIVAKIWHS